MKLAQFPTCIFDAVCTVLDFLLSAAVSYLADTAVVDVGAIKDHATGTVYVFRLYLMSELF